MRRAANAASRCALLCALLSGLACAPIVPSLVTGQLETPKVEPRDIEISEIEVVDGRAEADKQALSPQTRIVLPLLLWWQWASAGDVRPDAQQYTSDLSGDVRTLIEQALEQSGMLSPSPSARARKLKLKVVVQQLYGITHVDSSTLITVFTAGTDDRIFAPYGYASARVQLLDENGKELAALHVQGSSDPDLESLLLPGASPDALEAQLLVAAARATGSLATRIVLALEPLLSDDAVETRAERYEQRSSFFISRLLDDGAFLEVASVETASGRVLSDTVVKRWMEPYCAPGEWVLDPYQGGRARLSTEQYQRLVVHLGGAYDVRFVSDVNTAHFFGTRAVAPSLAASNAP
jgi:hypothetical protein